MTTPTGTGPTGPTGTGPTGTGPAGGGGRGMLLLIGGVAFALVFLLIVGGTVGFLILRPSSSPEPTTSPSTSATTASGGEVTATPSGSTDQDVTAERCWMPDSAGRTSTNPSGRLRGGGLEFIPPSAATERNTVLRHFQTDVQAAGAPVPNTPGWTTALSVGLVSWQDGVEYPGNQTAAETIFDCFSSNGNNWGDATGRSVSDQTTEPVTIAGMPGYRTQGTLEFSTSPYDFDAVGIMVVVLDTDQGPSVFMADWPVGIEGHDAIVEEAYGSLSGLSS